MKKIVLGISLLIFCSLSYGQTQVGGTGSPIYHKDRKVGIGTLSPTAQLSLGIWNVGECGILGGEQLTISGHHNLGANLGGIKLLIEGYDNDGSVTYPIFLKDENYNVDFWIKNRSAASGSPSMYFAGKIGVGITEPEAKLHVGVAHGYNKDEEIRIGSYYQNKFIGIGLNYRINSSGSVSKHLVDYQGGIRYTTMSFMKGNVGVGVDNPQNKLEVNGTIKATEIKVEAQTADFVFEEDYQLKPLNEVEAFIKTNKHLPEIPSAKQMETDGVNVAEMNKLLLQKVEELTLYVISMNNEMNVLKEKNKEQDLKLKAITQ